MILTVPGIPSTLKRRLRKVRRLAEKTPAGHFLSTVRARSSGKALRHILIVSDGSAYTSEQQFAPLIRHASLIAAKTGVVFTFMTQAKARTLPTASFAGWHAVGLKLTFKTPAAEAAAIARRILGAARAAGARTVLFDGDDDPAILWPEVLDLADTCIKKHIFADTRTYAETFVGKSNLTDHSSKTYGTSFSDDPIPRSGGLVPDQIRKIVLGWNIAQDDKIADLATDIPVQATQGVRDIDILCRASVPPGTWTYGMRNAAVQAIMTMSGSHRIHAPTDRVPQAEYYSEMLRARLSVSPFGYGELCWRDFESILCGSLLVKPDMSHLKTWPDLFVPFETYLSVRWDYSNLKDVCAPSLADESARLKMASNARSRLLDALDSKTFVERFATTMKHANLL